MPGPSAARRFGAVRIAWGLGCLAAPAAVAGAVGGEPADHPVVLVTRVLGVRHLLQGTLTLLRPTPGVLRLGAAADLAHAASMVALAGVDPSRRQVALRDGGLATGWAAASLAVGRGATRVPSSSIHP